MDVIVDGNANFQLQGEPADLLSAVAAVSDFLHESGRGILMMRLDGKAISAEDVVAELQGKSIQGVGELVVESEEVTKLVDDCLGEVQDVLPDLPKACHELAAVFQGEQPDEGYEPFEKLAAIWERIKTREIMAIRSLGLAVDVFAVDGRPLAALHEDLNTYLTEASDALKATDCVLLGDLLEYELAPRAETEIRIVSALQDEARRRAKAPGNAGQGGPNGPR
jgi:hypothetical protein